MEIGFCEPAPRFSQFSAVVEKKLFIYGGYTIDLYKERSERASYVYSFDPLLESWAENLCSGVPPPGLYSGGCAASGHHLYVYGGINGSQIQCSLHRLDTR
jgi:N-acetylneuraminic acid mutarotase